MPKIENYNLFNDQNVIITYLHPKNLILIARFKIVLSYRVANTYQQKMVKNI